MSRSAPALCARAISRADARTKRGSKDSCLERFGQTRSYELSNLPPPSYRILSTHSKSSISTQSWPEFIMSSKVFRQRRKISRSMRPRTSQSEVTASPASTAARRRSISCVQAASTWVSGAPSRLSISLTAAAERPGINQPKISALANYRLEGFSVERLMNFLNALGRDVEIVIRRPPSRRTPRIDVTAA
jgi:Helix-turn-helix domain